MDSSVFKRTPPLKDDIVSSPAYNLIIGLTLCWGFAVNWLMVVYITPSSLASINSWVFFIGYFASSFLGVHLFESSENPIISFVSYNLVVVPFGLIINLVVSRYNPSIVSEAIRITGIVTVIMMCIGTLFPVWFQTISGALTIALLMVIVVELGEMFVFHIHHGIIDWVVVLIFCGYIGYDWGRANRIPKTVVNAVDSAVSLYMDIINLFLRRLRVIGRK
jgi:FtsH-binding integral membrane protein